jgi:hypothetical protein
MSNTSARILYKPLGLAAGVTGGLIAGALFKQVWKRVAGDPESPEATDRTKGWGEVIMAATIQGAIFGAVKALLDRGGAEGFMRLTGEWPGDE